MAGATNSNRIVIDPTGFVSTLLETSTVPDIMLTFVNKVREAGGG